MADDIRKSHTSGLVGSVAGVSCGTGGIGLGFGPVDTMAAGLVDLEIGPDVETDEQASARERKRQQAILDRALARVDDIAARYIETSRKLGYPCGEFPGARPQPEPEWPRTTENRLSAPCVDRSIGYYAQRRHWG